jgi:ABC-type lipoprotein export system ATPase subunit
MLKTCASQLMMGHVQGVLQQLHILGRNKQRIDVLQGVSGVIKPGRFTLLLGPPSSGKSTLLKALAGKLKSTNLKARYPAAIITSLLQTSCLGHQGHSTMLPPLLLHAPEV